MCCLFCNFVVLALTFLMLYVNVLIDSCNGFEQFRFHNILLSLYTHTYVINILYIYMLRNTKLFLVKSLQKEKASFTFSSLYRRVTSLHINSICFSLCRIASFSLIWCSWACLVSNSITLLCQCLVASQFSLYKIPFRYITKILMCTI